MYAVKGVWVGQTFALAKRNESEVRKSRIRRSKEERKAMVEAFIKKYQESNSGSFPSLNLTHKEVGGSFYTVREIVRDIIQENRVLGPAKFTLEEHPSDQVLEQDLLGSIAVDPNTYFAASPNENHHEPSNVQDTSYQMLSGQHRSVEGKFSGNGNALNGSQVDVRNKEFIEQYGNENEISVNQSDETKQESFEAFSNGNLMHNGQLDERSKESVEASSPDFQASESLAAPQDVRNKEFIEQYGNENEISGSQFDETKQESFEAFSNGNLMHSGQLDETSKESVEASSPDFQANESLAAPEDVTQNLGMPKTNLSPVTADIVVETFPLRSVTSSAIGLESSGDFRGIIDSPENETKNLGLHMGKERSESESVELMKNSNLLNEKSVDDDLGNTSASCNEEEGKNVGHTSVKSTIMKALEEDDAHDNEICAGPQVKAHDQGNILTAEVIEQSQTISGAKTKVQDGFHAKTLTPTFTEESNTKEERLENMKEHRVNGKLGGSSEKTSPTLERINLDSWDGRSKDSKKQGINPIFAVFRAFVDAFVKFWSETE